MLGILTMVKRGYKGPYDINEPSKAFNEKESLELIHIPFRVYI